MRPLTILLLSGIMLSCSDRFQSKIIGEVTGIPADKVYLIDAYDSKKRVDSTDYKNGKFEFIIEDNKEPFLASIAYMTKENEMMKLAYRNNKLSINGKRNGVAAFMTDDGTITIKGDWTGVTSIFDTKHLEINAGPQNDYFQKYIHSNIGTIKNSSAEIHRIMFGRIKERVLENPSSFFLLSEIEKNKSSYHRSELKELISHFDQRVQSSSQAKILQKYASYMKEGDETTDPLSLKGPNSVVKANINRNKKLNMLVFWASWCIPCRSEIPQIRKIKEEFKSPDFYIASISIDRKKEDWLNALKVEKMDWDQFIINRDDDLKLNAQYDYSAIPLVVFTDQNGKILKRSTGASSDAVEEFGSFIKSLLVKSTQ